MRYFVSKMRFTNSPKHKNTFIHNMRTQTVSRIDVNRMSLLKGNAYISDRICRGGGYCSFFDHDALQMDIPKSLYNHDVLLCPGCNTRIEKAKLHKISYSKINKSMKLGGKTYAKTALTQDLELTAHA